MPPTLTALRQQTTQLTPTQFVRYQPACWIQYYDDTPAKNPAKALSTATFDLGVMERKQSEQCAVCFSLQSFGCSRTRDGFLCYHNLGIDIDLIPAAELELLSTAEIDQRKERYLSECLFAFPLHPHWLIETAHGFHAIFRVMPLRDPVRVQAAEALNCRLVKLLRGDLNAALLTQCLRVPGTRQFKNPEQPFLCRLLMNSATVAPHEIEKVRSVIDTQEALRGVREPQTRSIRPRRGGWSWRDGLAGVPEGSRNGAAAVIVGSLLCRLPEELWETGGWGGLKEWNSRNNPPLHERELRAVFESIARREQTRRQSGRARPQSDES